MVSNNPFHPEYDPPETETVHHISTTRPVAKKEYKCSCCGKPIAKGAKHYKNVFKIGKDDKIRWERAHVFCPEF